jgi:hypothetical protein
MSLEPSPLGLVDIGAGLGLAIAGAAMGYKLADR